MSFTFKISGKNLPVMDKGMEGSSCDPYFKLYVEDEKIYQSDSIKNTLEPEWEEFTLQRDEISGTPKIIDIKMVVKDKDWGNSDDFVGQLYFKIFEQEGPIRAMSPLSLKNEDGEDAGEIFIRIEENEWACLGGISFMSRKKKKKFDSWNKIK